MLEVGRRPGLRRMTHVALFGRIQMAVWFEGGTTASIIVTLVTSTDTAGIMRPATADEGSRGMARTAIQRGGDVTRVGLGFLTYCNRTVMAGCAVILDASVVVTSTDESFRGVTDATILVCWHMGIDIFTFGKLAVMTGLAVIHDTCMRKGAGDEARGLVAHAAILCCWYMVWRRCFASGRCAIVT